jgi:uncharacterized protein YeaO (DUF488 family)
VPKRLHAARDFYDVWYPDLAPSAAAVKLGRNASSDRAFAAFARRYRSEMSAPERRRTLDLLAALSHAADFSVGCYCEDERRCHRSILREMLRERGADLG